MSPELLGYVIEFSIGLAGFSGVIAVFSGRSKDRIQLELFRLRNLLLGALIPAILCFVALGLHRTMADEILAWDVTLTISVLLLSGYVIHAFRSRVTMSNTQKQRLQPFAFVTATSSLILTVLLQAAVLFDFLGIDQFDVFYFGLVVTLLVAMYQFVRAVLDGVRMNVGDQLLDARRESHDDD